MSNVRITILKEAMEAIDGNRDQQYGRPEDNFGRIAALWEAYLSHVEITEVDVANMMILLKIARSQHDPRVRDNWVDIAGYAGCAGEIMNQ